MLIFFGTRSTKIKSAEIRGGTECPNCKSMDSFEASTFAKYFHIFWIPFISLGKKTIVECSNCKKTYFKYQLPENVRRAIQQSDRFDPPKSPRWHNFGAIAFFFLFLLFNVVGVVSVLISDPDSFNFESDPRKEKLEADLEKVTDNPNIESQPIAFYLKTCVALSIEGIKTDKIQYYTKSNGNKLLVLLKVDDMKKINASSRKELVFAVEDCLDIYFTEKPDYYIGVDGRWNMLLVKTPYDEDLGGRFAKDELLYPFYDKPKIKKTSTEKDSTSEEIIKNDSTKIDTGNSQENKEIPKDYSIEING